MGNKFVKRIVALVAVAVMGMSVVACGGNAAGTEASSSALTEEEYAAKVEELQAALEKVGTEANSLDPTDVEGAKKLLEDLKAPFVEFAAVQAPEKYAEAQEKYKSGSEAMVEYIDSVSEMLDPEKAANVDANKIMELMTKAATDFQEGDNLLEAAQ
mgnify:FL=1